jgi:hypothetical protein
MTIAEYAWYLGIKDAMIAPLTITNISGGILNLQDQQGNIVQFGEPIQYSSAPTYIKGQIYFDTTLNKLRVGGISGWETISST